MTLVNFTLSLPPQPVCGRSLKVSSFAVTPASLRLCGQTDALLCALGADLRLSKNPNHSPPAKVSEGGSRLDTPAVQFAALLFAVRSFSFFFFFTHPPAPENKHLPENGSSTEREWWWGGFTLRWRGGRGWSTDPGECFFCFLFLNVIDQNVGKDTLTRV